MRQRSPPARHMINDVSALTLTIARPEVVAATGVRWC